MKHFRVEITQTDLRDPMNPARKKRTYYTLAEFVRAVEMYQAVESGHVSIEVKCSVSIEALEAIRA